MNLHRMLLERAAQAKPLRIGLIGAGKFGSMFLSQVPSTNGLVVAAIADLSPDRARAGVRRLERLPPRASGRAAVRAASSASTRRPTP